MQCAWLGVCLVGLATVGFGPAASAATIEHGTYSGGAITGTLPSQDTVLYESISISSTSNFYAYTTSYATGGFEPSLALFNPSGVMSGCQDGMAPAGATADPMTGSIYDVGYSADHLTPGTYTFVISDWQVQQSLTATNLSDGYTVNYGNGTSFVDFNGASRTGAYDVIVKVTPSSGSTVPEPASVLLIVPALGLVFLARKKKLN